MPDTQFNADGGGSGSFMDILNATDVYAPTDGNPFTMDLGSSVFPTTSPTSGNDFMTALSSLANNAATAAGLYYGTQGKISAAKNNAAIIAASGSNAVQTAKSGLPSPTLLMVGGFGLAAILLLTSKK